MSILPISNVINVSITNTPSGLTERNVNSLALFTNDATLSMNPYEIYISASEVAADYGTGSVTTAMANAIFAQSPNLRSGNGRLVIIPMLAAVSATPGTFTSADISANLAAIKAITNGDLKITVNTVAYNLTGITFANTTTWADIAAVVQGHIVDALVEATSNGIKITSKKVGTSSTVTIGAVSGGTGTALNGSGYFNGAGGTSVTGVNSSGETLVQAIARTESAVGYVPVITKLNLEDAVISTTAAAIQAMDKMFLHHVASTQDIAGIATTVSAAGETKTRLLLYTVGIAQANLMKSAYAGRGFSVNFSGSNTSQTMNLKQLATIDPDLGISQTNYTNANTAGVDLYVSYDGVPSVYSTGGNDYFDNPYSDLALKFAMETAGFNFLRQTNTKVPQTEQGMNGLKNAYSQVCQRFLRNGCVAPGSWTSSETFGDPEIFRNNILTRGYYVYSQPITQQSAVEREAREAPLVQIAIKRAGAIHTSDVIVLVND
jgi:hypothetical protein